MKYEGRKNAKRIGYAVEYDAVKNLQSLGWWAMRNPYYNQRGPFSCIDFFYYDPFRKIFGMGQAKRREKYLHKEEIERIKSITKKYNAEAMFVWRDRGLKSRLLN